MCKNLVIFASGSGSNFLSIIKAIKNGTLKASVTGLITDNPHAGACTHARNNNIPVSVIPGKNNPSFSITILEVLNKWKPDFIVLAGFLSKIPESVVELFPNRIINIHPSLLPKYGGKGFYGLHVHKAVLEAGDAFSGCTVHFVNNEYDKGDIIAQQKVPVLPDDTPETLAARVLKAEHKLLPQVISQLINRSAATGYDGGTCHKSYHNL